MTKEYLKMADVFGGASQEYFEQLLYSGFMSKDSCELIAHAVSSHDELVAEVERLREFERDAMRYRFLRECHWNESPLCVVVNPKKMVKIGADCPTTTRLDDAIDEMLA